MESCITPINTPPYNVLTSIDGTCKRPSHHITNDLAMQNALESCQKTPNSTIPASNLTNNTTYSKHITSIDSTLIDTNENKEQETNINASTTQGTTDNDKRYNLRIRNNKRKYNEHDKAKMDANYSKKTKGNSNKNKRCKSKEIHDKYKRAINEIYTKNIELPTTKKRKKTTMDPDQRTLSAFEFELQETPPQKGRKKPNKSNENTSQNIIPPYFNFSHNEASSTAGQPLNTKLYADDNGLRIITYNIRCSLKEQIDELMAEININGIDVAFITETGLNKNNYKDKRIMNSTQNRNYRFISTEYIDNKNSHIAIIIRKDLNITDEITYQCGRIISILLQTKKRIIRIMGIYQGFDDLKNKEIRKLIKK